MAKIKMAKRRPAKSKSHQQGGCGPVPPVFKPLRFDTPAFPRAMTETDPVGQSGMTLRDYFAGQALIGILGARQGFMVDVGTDNAPTFAYRIADKMLEERKQ
jgi:hypothetical protein